MQREGYHHSARVRQKQNKQEPLILTFLHSNQGDRSQMLPESCPSTVWVFPLRGQVWTLQMPLLAACSPRFTPNTAEKPTQEPQLSMSFPHRQQTPNLPFRPPVGVHACRKRVSTNLSILGSRGTQLYPAEYIWVNLSVRSTHWDPHFFFFKSPLHDGKLLGWKDNLVHFQSPKPNKRSAPRKQWEKNLLAGWLMRQMMCLVLVSVAELYPLQVSKNLRYWMGLVNNREKTKGTTHWDPNTGVIQRTLSHRRFYLLLKYFILCKKK